MKHFPLIDHRAILFCCAVNGPFMGGNRQINKDRGGGGGGREGGDRQTERTATKRETLTEFYKLQKTCFQETVYAAIINNIVK